MDPYKQHINQVHHLQMHHHIYKLQLILFIHILRVHYNQYYLLIKHMFLLYYIHLFLDLLCDRFHKNHNRFQYEGIYIYKFLHLHHNLMFLLDHINNLKYIQLDLILFILNQIQQVLVHQHYLITINGTILSLKFQLEKLIGLNLDLQMTDF